ncbi:MAG: hypothetical protein JST89_07790 [Cyanobacteria bacterium SZAS-4]|nr:hypothetical protein [Cyanobacteria bacterium SZAS-4]
MKSIQKEQVLRLNCPGFGEESYLTIGKAKPLDNYDVIVANPVSILHLFDREPDVLKEIDGKLDEGLTSFALKNDSLLQALESDLKKRIFELVSFLERGGLLVYYLCRPFLLQGTSLSMDNYFWLESLAPDTPVENNVRHMSAVSHGRTIEPTEQADKSEFASYFQQSGLEWNTIIRTDFLTEGYIVLATAGPRKCIAAHLIAGDNGGRIIFLPAPYSPDFDRTLMDCVNNWYVKRSGEEEPVAVAANAAGAGQKFPQPDNSFLKPEPIAVPAGDKQTAKPAVAAQAQQPAAVAAQTAPTVSRTGLPAQNSGSPSSSKTGMPAQPAAAIVSPSSSRTGIPAQTQATGGSPSASRTGMPSQNPSTSRTGLPPVQKFDARVSRSQPQGPSDSDNAKKKMTAEEILESVSAQAEVVEAPAEKQPFNERTTADIGTAFNSLNQPLPQHNADQAGVPSAADLLKELESVGTKAPGAAAAEETGKDEDASEAGSRNLLKEMESLAGPPQTTQSTLSTPSQPTPSKAVESIADKPSTDFSNYKFAAEDTNVGDPGYQYGIEEQTAASKQPAKPASKFEAAAKSGAPSAPPQGISKSEPVKATSQDSGNNNHETETPEAKDLIKKMEEMTKAPASEWCAEYSFSDLDDLRREKSALVDSIKQAQTKISSIDTKISQLDGLKNALLSSDGEDLMNASAIVFKRLGWGAESNAGTSSELLLSADRPEAIVRVLRTNSQPKSSDIAQLAQSVITFWGEHEVEPKGVLVSCTWANRPPSERNEPDYTDALSEFAQKKNLALMTTMQLLCIYRDLEMGKANAEEIRKRILETNGKLLGYSLEHTMTKATASS